jgi:hypothetical protein
MITDEQINNLLALTGVCEGGPSDLADYHDLYLRWTFVLKNCGEILKNDGLNGSEIF